jgi:threonine dehydrogenase-like Zn-dependent dehydrogenase
MKAISLPAPGQVAIVDIPEPSVGPEDVLVQVRYVGLCGSDLGMYRGTFAIGTYPRIPGHEVSGIVVGRGDAVPDTIGLGDRVTIFPYSECGICPPCRSGRPNCCQFNETLGLQRDGALAERFAIHYAKVSASKLLTLEELVLVEPLSVGYHAANRGRVSELDTVLVIGCGTIGLGVIAAAAQKGATVIAADIDDSKLAQAQTFGAQHTINSIEQDVLAAVRELTSLCGRADQGEGVSVAIEAVGLPETYRLAVEAVAFAGRVVCVGYAKTEASFDTTLFVRKELDILGARNALRVFPAVIRMLEARKRPFQELISRVYSFEETCQSLRDWSESPSTFTKIVIDVVDVPAASA